MTTKATFAISSWLVLVLAMLASFVQSAGACTRDDAFNRMMALNQYGMKLQAALPDPLKDPHGYEANYKRVIDFNSRLGAVGKVLAAQKYDDACATYDALAKEYGVNIAAQGVRPLAAYEADAKSPPKAGCDLAESSRRSMWLAESFKQHAGADHLGRDDWQRFGKDAEAVGQLMQQDPEKACELIDRVAARYGFQR